MSSNPRDLHNNNHHQQKKRRLTLCFLRMCFMCSRRMQKVVQHDCMGESHHLFEIISRARMEIFNTKQRHGIGPRTIRFPSAQILENMGGLLVAHCKYMNLVIRKKCLQRVAALKSGECRNSLRGHTCTGNCNGNYGIHRTGVPPPTAAVRTYKALRVPLVLRL